MEENSTIGSTNIEAEKELSIADVQEMLSKAKSCDVIISQRNYKIKTIEIRQKKFCGNKGNVDFFSV